jgi:hypothetical protein
MEILGVINIIFGGTVFVSLRPTFNNIALEGLRSSLNVQTMNFEIFVKATFEFRYYILV